MGNLPLVDGIIPLGNLPLVDGIIPLGKSTSDRWCCALHQQKMFPKLSVEQIELFQRAAIEQAKLSLANNEVPIGAIVTNGTEIIGKGSNNTERLQDPTAHAEIIAIRQATQTLGNWRLTNCALFVTIEPCTMCAGAILNTRLDTLVFGAHEPRTGAVESLYNVIEPYSSIRVIRGVLESECKNLMEEFFKSRRQ